MASGISRRNSPKRLVPLSNRYTMGNFHLPPTIERVSSTGHTGSDRGFIICLFLQDDFLTKTNDFVYLFLSSLSGTVIVAERMRCGKQSLPSSFYERYDDRSSFHLLVSFTACKKI